MADTSPVPLLSPGAFDRATRGLGLPGVVLEVLLGIDRAVRNLSVAPEFEGFAISGHTALAGIYGLSRAPTELTVARDGRRPELSDPTAYVDAIMNVVELVSSALPSAMRPEPLDRTYLNWQIRFVGVREPVVTLPVTFARHVLRMGSLVNDKMPWNMNLTSPFPVRFAYAEELIAEVLERGRLARDLVAFADLREIILLYPDAVVDAIHSGTLPRLLEHVLQPDGTAYAKQVINAYKVARFNDLPVELYASTAPAPSPDDMVAWESDLGDFLLLLIEGAARVAAQPS